MSEVQEAYPGVDLAYSHDGIEMSGQFFAGPAGAPGLLVVHGAHGLTPFITDAAARISALGYSVLAVDLWGGGRLISDPADIGSLLGACAGDRAMWMGRVAAAHAALTAQPGVDATRIGAVGYCFGGATVLEFARSGGAVKAVVSLHGGLDLCADDWGPQSRGEVLICTGAADPMAKAEDLSRLTVAMSAAGTIWQAEIYGGVKHAFTEPDSPGRPPFAAYDARADRRSWAAMTRFFAETLA
ncbi:MAG TPA: dienelactone hydrolase family protein [Paenirhodobacter sp.]